MGSYTIKRPKLETELNVSLDRLLLEKSSVIPALSRCNESLQSPAHTEDTGHADATPLGREGVEFEKCTRSGSTARAGGGQREQLDISTLLRGNIHAEYSANQESLLLRKLGDQVAFQYQNESIIATYASLALEDALTALGLDRLLSVQPEISVFSYRPDIIVVTHSTLGIILVVEVKKPGPDVFTSHSVAGQVYDYLVGMLGMGIAFPFVVLTTYDEMVITHLDDDGSSQSLMKEVATKMGEPLDSEKEFLRDGCKGDRGEESKLPGGPLSKRNLVVSTSQTGDDTRTTSDHPSQGAGDGDSDDGDSDEKTDGNDSDDSDWNRSLCYSKVVQRENVLKAWMFVIRCALQSRIRSPQRDIPHQGDTPTFACARVNKQGMVWGDLPSGLTVDYFTTPKEETESFYLLNDLGRGSNGRAYLICSSGGKACVAKFYLIKDRPRESAYERQERRTTLLQDRKSEAEQEKEYWVTLYEGKYDVDVKQLHGHWCLFLPYFDPIPDVPTRLKYLPKIQNILEHFDSKGLKYKDDDLRWRHVGLRKGEVCLFDLGSLELRKEGSNIDVKEQVQILKDRIEDRLG